MGDTFVGEVPQRYYDQYFFNEMRWDYLYVKSRGINTVIVDGESRFRASIRTNPGSPAWAAGSRSSSPDPHSTMW